MKKWHEYLGKRKPVEGDVGIEIECEGKGFNAVDNALWRSEDDGSLRGRFPDSRVEYVLQKPIPIDTVKFALEELTKVIPKAVPDFSFRTSVHVHVNVQDMGEEQIQNYVYTYLLLEEALFSFCGNTRKANRFCLRLQDADYAMSYLKPLFRNGPSFITKMDENQTRYAAINLAAMRKYGSIEFRGMRGTLDINTLTVWATALVSIRNCACHYANCLDIHDDFVTMGPEKFLSHVLGDLASHFTYKNMVRDMQQSYSLTLELPYDYKKSIEAPKPIAKKKEEPVNMWEIPREFVNVNLNAAIAAAPRIRLRQAQVNPIVFDDIQVEEVHHEEP